MKFQKGLVLHNSLTSETKKKFLLWYDIISTLTLNQSREIYIFHCRINVCFCWSLLIACLPLKQYNIVSSATKGKLDGSINFTYTVESSCFSLFYVRCVPITIKANLSVSIKWQWKQRTTANDFSFSNLIWFWCSSMKGFFGLIHKMHAIQKIYIINGWLITHMMLYYYILWRFKF